MSASHQQLLQLMQHRRSIRRFKPEPPPKETLEKLIQAAISAPSASNKQSWRFFIVQDKALIRSLAEAVDEARLRLKDQIKTVFQEEFIRYSKNFTTFIGAPALIVPLYRTFPGLSGALGENADAEDRRVITRMEQEAVVMSVSLAVQNLLLMAHALGLGACCMTGPLIAGKELYTILKIPKGWCVATLVSVGFPDEQPPDPGRKPLSKVVRWK